MAKRNKLEQLMQLQMTLMKKREKIREDLNKTESELDTVNREILMEGLIKLKGKDIQPTGVTIGDLKIPIEWKTDLPQEGKVLYALSFLKKATVREIADHLIQFEKEMKPDAVYKMVQQVINKLKKEFKIKGTEGYKSKYELMIRG